MIRNESLDWLLVALAATLLFACVLTRSEPEPRSTGSVVGIVETNAAEDQHAVPPEMP